MIKILLINDTPSTSAMLTLRLESAGFAVDKAETAKEGIEKAKTEDYQVILLDHNLPDKDGAEVCQILKKTEKTKNIPVLFLSAKENNELQKIVKETHADGFISLYSFKKDKFIKCIKAVMDRKPTTHPQKDIDKSADTDKENTTKASPREEAMKINNAKGVTLYEEDFYETRQTTKQEGQLFLLIKLAEEWYGIKITDVKEVRKLEKICYLPKSPDYIAGIINLSGSILSVTDLKKILNLPEGKQHSKSRLIVVESGIYETAILADEVIGTQEIPIEKIDPPLSTIADEKAAYIEGECKIDDKLIGILKVEEIFAHR